MQEQESLSITGSSATLSSNAQDPGLRLREAMDQMLPIGDLSPSANPLLHVTNYALASKGKLLRGRMLLEACRAVAGDAEKALCAAVAMEYLHVGTLVHDDMIDRDDLRRGRPAVWRQYGSDMALLDGDFLYFAAFQMLARSFDADNARLAARVFEVFSTTCMDLCLGQALEERLAGNCAARYEEYLEVVRLKTARLFRAALEIGALLGGGTEEQVELLGTCAEQLGIAFQISDDLLPFTSDSATIGKPVTSDIKNHRVTAPILAAFAEASETDQQMLRAIFAEGRFDERLEEAYQATRAILNRTQALESMEREATNRYQQAINLLHSIPYSEGCEQLVALANQLVQRNR